MVCRADTPCQLCLSDADLSRAEKFFFAAAVVVAVAADGSGAGTDASCRFTVSDVQEGHLTAALGRAFAWVFQGRASTVVHVRTGILLKSISPFLFC